MSSGDAGFPSEIRRLVIGARWSMDLPKQLLSLVMAGRWLAPGAAGYS
jgi:hypothetical protein